MYCAEIPRNAVDNAGLFYYIYAQDNHGSQGWSGSPESPLQLTVPQVSPSTSNPMSIYVGIQSVSIFCEMIQIGDKISTYFQNECGNYQLGGSVTYSAGDAIMGMIIVPAYGDSDPNDGYKDGFEDNDEVQVRLERNGYEYILQFPYPVVYHPNYGNVMTRPIYGPGVPDITINYNGNGINAGSIQTSTANGTDFGEKSAAVTHTFTVQNVGCEDMVINGGTVDDAENFSIAAPYAIVPPNGTYTFTVTYNAEETATTMVNLLNSASPSSYRFTVTGQAAGGSNFDCEMEISPNPVPSYGANIAFTLPELTTLTAKVLTISGTTVRTFFGPIMMGAGRHSLYLQPYDLIPGQSYIISVETNSGVCSKIFMVSQ